MGGNLAWTLRLSNGTEYRMDRWTNALSELITDPLFFNEDEKHIQTCLESWLAMKEDWEANKDTGKFEHNMTKVYAPYPYGLKPSEYGIIITDFANGVFLSNQGYTSFDADDLYWIDNGRDFLKSYRPEVLERLLARITDNKIRHYEVVAESQKAAEDLLSVFSGRIHEGLSSKEIIVHLDGQTPLESLEDHFGPKKTILPSFKRPSRDYYALRAIRDTSPFVFEEYEPTAEGWTAMLERVKSLSFSLSDEEEQAWLEHIREIELEE